MHRFNSIGRIDDPANILGIFEKLAESLPVVPPGFDDDRVLVILLAGQNLKFSFGQILAAGLVDSLEIGHEPLLVFRADIQSGPAAKN